jgi:dTMP kinase
MHIDQPGRGQLVSLEGLNGVGKTYLTGRLVHHLTRGGHPAPVVVEEFSARASDDTDLSRRLLGVLIGAAEGEHFLRGGFPGSETLLLLAIKMHDYEANRAVLASGRTVIEGRSIHSTAVYQALITHPDDDSAARSYTKDLVVLAGRWRPLPDLTIVVTDDVDVAVQRAEARDGRRFTADQWQLHRRAAGLFEHLAAIDPDRVRLVDRRDHNTEELVGLISDWITTAALQPPTTVFDVPPDQLTKTAGTAARRLASSP